MVMLIIHSPLIASHVHRFVENEAPLILLTVKHASQNYIFVNYLIFFYILKYCKKQSKLDDNRICMNLVIYISVHELKICIHSRFYIKKI